MPTPTERAQQLVDTSYNNMYVDINTGHHIFRFLRPMGDLFKTGLKNKCKEQVVLMIDDFLAYIAEVWGDDNDEYAYWEDVKTAVVNL